jgi:hypothetical protein
LSAVESDSGGIEMQEGDEVVEEEDIEEGTRIDNDSIVTKETQQKKNHVT